MTNKEILQKAIVKALLNGFDIDNLINDYIGLFEHNNYFINEVYYILKEQIIFSHDFAKAFWGTKIECEHLEQVRNCCGCNLDTEYCQGKFYKWQNHLKKMVCQEEPLKYLEKFLDED